MPLDNVSNLLPGLLPARWRGIDFHMPDTSSAAGRRVAEHLFPGINHAAYDDMGMAPEEITISGILLGDDYIAQAQRLRSAFKSAGPSTLMHPWLGGLSVILETPGEISFSDKELRVARFYATFKVVSGRSSFGIFSLTNGRVISAISSVISFALSLGNVRSNIYANALRRTKRLASSSFSSLSLLDNEEFITSFNDQIKTIKDKTIVIESPVGSAAETKEDTPLITSQTLCDLLSNGIHQLNEEILNAPSITDKAQLSAITSIALSYACELTLHINFATRNEAVARRKTLSDEITALSAELSQRAFYSDIPQFASLFSEMDRSLIELNAALHDDINEAVGRLPVLHRLVIDRPTDAFALAHHLYGDTPDLIEDAYRSIVSRNKPRHPAALLEGIIEIER